MMKSTALFNTLTGFNNQDRFHHPLNTPENHIDFPVERTNGRRDGGGGREDFEVAYLKYGLRDSAPNDLQE